MIIKVNFYYLSLSILLMNSFKVLKRNSHENPALTQRTLQGGAILWRKRSTIFTHTNADLFQGLLAMTKNSSSCYSESHLEDQFDPLSFSVIQEAKNDDENNPFKMAKMKAMLKKKSGEMETCSSNKDQKGTDPFSDIFQLKLPGTQDENEVVTWREVKQKEKIKKRQVLKCLTDRVNRR